MTEHEIDGCHHQLNEHGFGWTLGVGDGQGGLACCGSWGHKVSDSTERLNSTEQLKQWHTLFFCAPKSLQMVSAVKKLKGLLLGSKAITNIDSILESGDITLPTKFHLVKAMVFPVVMSGCESWTVQKAECWRIDSFELWFWRRLLRIHP